MWHAPLRRVRVTVCARIHSWFFAGICPEFCLGICVLCHVRPWRCYLLCGLSSKMFWGSGAAVCHIGRMLNFRVAYPPYCPFCECGRMSLCDRCQCFGGSSSIRLYSRVLPCALVARCSYAIGVSPVKGCGYCRMCVPAADPQRVLHGEFSPLVFSYLPGGGYCLLVTLHRIDRRGSGLWLVSAAHWLALLSSLIVYHDFWAFAIGKVYEMHNSIL